MNEESTNKTEASQEDETMAKLLRVAGPRADIPPDAESRVYDRVLRDWQSSTQQPDTSHVYDRVLNAWQNHATWSRRRRWILPLGVAASAILAVALVTQPVPAPKISIATVSKVVGSASAGVVGDSVFAGDLLETGSGDGLSLLLARSESLRIAEKTQLRVDAKDHFTLLGGRVYADTGEFVYRDGGLIIDTSIGSVTDVGTQFAVSLNDEELDIAVREGRVDVQQETMSFVALAGERLLIADNGEAQKLGIAANDQYWAWVSDLAPNYDIENRSLLDFLKWAARETGKELVFESNEIRVSAMRTDLHGSIEDFTPEEALESVLATTSFDYRIEAERIVIER